MADAKLFTLDCPYLVVALEARAMPADQPGPETVPAGIDKSLTIQNTHTARNDIYAILGHSVTRRPAKGRLFQMRETSGENGMDIDGINSADDLFSALVLSIFMTSLLVAPVIIAMGHAIAARNMLSK
jgi:hypothetical protein